MGYVVEDVSVEDREKILADVAPVPRLVNRFGKWRVFTDPKGPYSHMRWAVDRERNSYLFRSESFARELDNECHFFFNGEMYEVAVSGTREANGGRKVEIRTTDVAGPLSALSEEFKQSLTAAFRVHGLQGYGECRRDGKNFAHDVTPVFGGEG